MCTYSMIADDFMGRRRDIWPTHPVGPLVPLVPAQDDAGMRKEIEALKKQVEELKKLLLASKGYDAAMGHPDCEIDEKVLALRTLAEAIGVEWPQELGGA